MSNAPSPATPYAQPLLQEVIDALPQQIAIFDQEDRIVALNRAGREFSEKEHSGEVGESYLTTRGKLAVALTAFGRVQDRLRALMAGFEMHLSKPVELAELVLVAASLTGREIAGQKGKEFPS